MMLKNTFQGRAGERIPHTFLNTLANFWNTFRVTGGGMRKSELGDVEILIPDALANLHAAFYVGTTNGTDCIMEPGSFFLDGTCLPVIDIPATIVASADLRTWIRYDSNDGTAQWASGTAFPTTAGTLAIYPVHAISSDGTTIGTVFHCHPADFHVSSATAAGSASDFQTVFQITDTILGTGTWSLVATINFRQGRFYRDDVEETVDDMTGTIEIKVTEAGTKCAWIRWDEGSAFARWETGTAFPDSSPDSAVFPVFEIPYSATALGTPIHHNPADIHSWSIDGTPGTWTIIGTLDAEGTEEASGGTWAAGGATGLKYRHSERSCYSHDGSHVLFDFRREAQFSAKGRLLFLGADTRVVIEDPIAHSLVGT